jgi:hypothetical protein
MVEHHQDRGSANRQVAQGYGVGVAEMPLEHPVLLRVPIVRTLVAALVYCTCSCTWQGKMMGWEDCKCCVTAVGVTAGLPPILALNQVSRPHCLQSISVEGAGPCSAACSLLDAVTLCNWFDQALPCVNDDGHLASGHTWQVCASSYPSCAGVQ